MKLPKMPNFKGLATMGKAAVAAHRPEILFGTSLVTTVGAVVAAGIGGYKSGVKMSEHVTGEEIDTSVVPVKEKIQLTWLNYLPAAGLTAGALGATTGLHLVHVKEKKAIAAAALMAIEEVKEQGRNYVNDLSDAITEQTDEETSEKVMESADRKYTSRMVEAGDMYMVRDEQTGRTFYGTENKVQSAINEVNRMLQSRDVSLNDFYVWAGVPELKDGEEIGWNAGDFIIVKWDDDHLDDGRPVRAFSFQGAPRKGFDANHR